MKNYKIIGFNPLILGNPSIFVRDFSRSVLENIISLIEADELLASLNPRSLVSSEPLKTNDASESFLKNSNETGQSYGQQLTNFVSPNFTIESQTAFATNSYSSYLSQIGSRENFSISEIKVSPTTKINHTLSEKLDRIELESGFFRNNASSSNIILANAVVEKIHSNLLQDIIAAARRTQLQFVARIKAGTDLDAYTEQWFVRPFIDPLGSTVASGFASASALLKMASDAKVISLQRAESLLEVPTKFSDPDVAAAIEARSRPEPQGWFHTGGAIHGSQEAWAKGYTGKGVRYMSNDSGADYAHPDLLGTWAYIEDPASPYYGLPQMFDSWSSYVAAFDFRLGTSFIADGVADYADTSATALGNFRYSPLGAKVEHNYIVPNTSLSGVYHYGSHPDKALANKAEILNGIFGDGTAVKGERAAILVVDEEKAGVYDTVYVDLNFNFDFTDETPARLTRDFTYQEVAALDYNNDNLNDISGGLVYFISDGKTALPTLDWYWGIPGSFFGNGDLVAFHVMDDSEGGGDHGMGTTSVAVGQGVVTGSVFAGPDGTPQAGGRGLVVGPGKDVASTQNGNWYISPFIEDGYIYAGLGYDGISGTSDDIQIVSNSWGFSGINNDGYDYQSRLIDSINRTLAPNTALLFSTGNGAPGYGTVAPPSPASGIGVGASTLFGSIGLFESIASAKQIVGGDVMSWSNRGPGVNIDAGVDVVATGAFGTGADPLNQTLTYSKTKLALWS
ncbi:MAG: S8 family serine peptidase [Prochloraceae cyanobacterium]|nr:S8 family serine peptidase [Prochloraceae cyanobacterium]